MIVYKVVTYKGRSAIIRGEAAVQYRLGEETRPPVRGTPLFAFKTLEAASWWAGQFCGRYHILECEARLSSTKFTHLLAALSVSPTIAQLRAFWTRSVALRTRYVRVGGRWQNFPLQESPPRDTVMCSMIKPIRELEL